jgi:chemotaxis protein CheD
LTFYGIAESRFKSAGIINKIEDDSMGYLHIHSQAVSRMTAVNASAMKISSNPVDTLVAFSICSGVGVAIYDPVSNAGGILNFLLPDSARANGVDPARVPFMFADTGLPAFIAALTRQNVQPTRSKIVIAGGAHVMNQTEMFNIGQKNLAALKARLANYGLKIYHENSGGTSSRTLSLEISTGCSSIQIFGEGQERV